MIYCLNTYRPQRGFEALRAAREDDAWLVLRQAGAAPLGLWRVLLGGDQRDALELVRYDSLVHWRQCADATGAAPPEPPEQAIALRPLTRRQPEGEPVPVSRNSVWALRRFVPSAGQAQRIASLSEEKVWPGFFSEMQAGGRQYTLGMFLAHVAEEQELLMLSYYAEIGDWEETRAAQQLEASGEPGHIAVAALAERATLIERNGVRMLASLSSRGPTSESCTRRAANERP